MLQDSSDIVRSNSTIRDITESETTEDILFSSSVMGAMFMQDLYKSLVGPTKIPRRGKDHTSIEIGRIEQEEKLDVEFSHIQVSSLLLNFFSLNFFF